MRNLLVAGNSTMPRSVGIWNLPALKTCTPSPWCREFCYGLQGRFIWKPIKEGHQWRYMFSKSHQFTQTMIDEIRRRKNIKYVRPHITGDFYSQEYLHKWIRIAQELPDILFRLTTRRQDLLPTMRKRFPKNVVIRESIDPTRKSTGLVPVHAVKGTPGSDNYFVCQNDCEACNFHCWTHPKVNVRAATIL